MDTNLEYYKVFREVANRLSFSAAANALFITQPAVSQTINALEKSLGVTLFFRTAKGVVLTVEGKHMFEYVNSALNMLETGEDKLGKLLQLEQGEVTIAVPDTISKHYLLPYLMKFNLKFPNVKIKVINRTSDDSIALVKNSFADIAFVNLPAKNISGLYVSKCKEVHDVFVASEKFTHLKGKKISPVDLSKEPLILLESISATRRYIDDYFMKHSIRIYPEIELGSHDLLLEFSKIGLGISCVIKEFAEEYLKTGELFELKLSPALKARQIGIVYSKKIPLSNTASEFVKYIDTKDYSSKIKE